MAMFKQAFGSPRGQLQQEDQQTSILSPRNFLKIISNSINDLRRPNLSTPNQSNYQQFLATFQPYLKTFEDDYKKMKESNRIRKNLNNKNEELQLQLKINRIPSIYFTDCDQFQLQLCKRGEARKKQEQMTQYLDQIQLVLFTKSGKYPEKSHIILDNMSSLGQEVQGSLARVLHFRSTLKEKLVKKSEKQLRVRKIQQKIARVKKAIAYAQIMKKMKDIKDFSSSSFNEKSNSNEDILIKIRKNDLEQCSHFKSLGKIVKNIQNYRTMVKQKLYKQFLSQIEVIFTALLKYNKQQWKNINVPQSIFNNAEDQNTTNNNITILNESYFAFEHNHVNIVSKKKEGPATITEQNEDEDENDTLDLNKINKLWAVIRQFDLYDQDQVNENFTKILMKHSIGFNRDMQEYLSYLYDTYVKEKGANILQGPQTYASLKTKKMREESRHKQIESSHQIELSQQKISAIDMKLFIKIVKYEFTLLKKVLSFLKQYKQLQFLTNFQSKFQQFLEGNITYFINLKKVNHEMSVQDFISYLDIINFWENEQYYEIEPFCEQRRNMKIDQYLTCIQKNLLIKDIKGAIQQSSYLPVNVSSDNYMTFQYVLAPNSVPHFEDEDMNMSVTLQHQEGLPEQPQNSTAQNVTLRLINKTITYKDKIYKICDSFLELIKNIQKYVKLKMNLCQFQQNIQEKMCQLIGFYAWYNQKTLTSPKNGAKTLKNYCTFYSTLMLLKEILSNLGLTNKKIEKTKVQLNDCQTQLGSSISMTPFRTIQNQISQLYESKISMKTLCPTVQTQRIIQIIKISFECLKEYFPIEYEDKLHQSLIYKFLQISMRQIQKNYCGYLANMENKRGLMEIKWFLPRLRQVVEITIVRDSNLVNKKGELICKDGSRTFCFFGQELQSMQRVLKQKMMTK